MAFRPSNRVLAYACAIAMPTVVLLVLGLQSVRRQQDAIAQLEAANLRLTAETLAQALAARVQAAAVGCLRDEDWPGIAGPSATARPARLRAVQQRHPVARHLLLADGNDVLYPRLVTPLDVESPPSGDPACAAAIEIGESHEFSGRVRESIVSYRRCLAMAPDPVTHARVLARLARAHRRAGESDAALDAWQALAVQHADRADRFGRPFGLVAALEWHDLRPQHAAPMLRRARADLALGRWDVSDEQARYFLDELQQRLGTTTAPEPSAPFFEALALARALQSRLPMPSSRGEGSVQVDELMVDGRRTRVYHGVVSDRDAQVRAVIVPDPDWMASTLLPAAAERMDASRGARLVTDDAVPAAPGVVASADGALAPWRIWVPAPAPSPSARWVPVLLQGAITLIVSGVLGMGVLLLVRDVRREQSIAQMRSQFVSAASHELRTPLAMILLYAQTLLEDVDADREERRGSYEIIAEESERLRHLLDKVLDFSRIDAGRRSYRFVTGALDDSVRAAVRLFEPQLARRGFTLDADLARVGEVRHDPEAITGAVLNLLENAAKYSGSAREIHLRLAADAHQARIDVRDHGIGIPPADVPRLGEQFFRSRLSTAIGGYGLGLYLVTHAMTAHGGRLDVTSTPDEGSTFSLVMPRAGAPPASRPDGEGPQAGGTAS